jgi:hypothetical protein
MSDEDVLQVTVRISGGSSKDNLSDVNRKSHRALRANTDVIARPADKDDVTVVLSAAVPKHHDAMERNIVLKMEAENSSETLLSSYDTRQSNIPEDSNLHTHEREKLRSQVFIKSD